MSTLAEHESHSLMQSHRVQTSTHCAEDMEDCSSDSTQIASRDTSPFRKWSRRRSPSDLSTWSEGTHLPRHHSGRSQLSEWLPWAVVIWLQSCILVMLFWMSSNPERYNRQPELPNTSVETGSDINGLFKDVSHVYTHLKPNADKFVPNMTSNDDRMAIRRNWDHLMPLGSGSVAIPDYASHPLLGNPIVDDPIRSGPLFEASWTHALHCLYYTLDSYHQLLLFFQDPSYNISTYHTNGYHATHCFEYLRNNIMCNLDMTLEGDQSLPEEKELGQPHVCRNYDEAVRWIEERRVDDFQDIVGP